MNDHRTVGLVGERNNCSILARMVMSFLKVVMNILPQCQSTFNIKQHVHTVIPCALFMTVIMACHEYTNASLSYKRPQL